VPALVEKIGLKTGLPVANLMVSNPFGLTEKRYLMGAPVVWALPVSVVPAGQLLNVTAVTLDDRLQIGFLAMPEAVPGVEKLAGHAAEAFEEIKEAVLGKAAASPLAQDQPGRTRAPRKVARSAAPAPANAAASAKRKPAASTRKKSTAARRSA